MSDSVSEPDQQPEEEKSPLQQIFSGLATIVFALALAFGVQAFVIKPYTVPSGSMLPTIEIGNKIFTDRLTYRLSQPSVGDIIVFNPPMGARDQSCVVAGQGAKNPENKQPCGTTSGARDRSIVYVKRVVALAGDKVSFQDGYVYVNGQRSDKYFRGDCGEQGSGCDLPQPIVVPPGHVYASGDNRSASADSRFWGPVPTKWILGKAFFTYWPLNKMGSLK